MRPLGKLTDVKCRTARPGIYSDGGGLVLQGREHRMGLGSYPDVTLARAREKAQDARRLRIEGQDPLATKRAERLAQRQEQTRQTMTFDACRDAYVASHRDAWRNVRHAHDWVQSLETHVSPVFGNAPVNAIDTALVCRALEPLWRTKVETAARVRGRIERILDWAQTRGLRRAEPNPARWKGHLANLLPARSKVTAVEHYPAIPYVNVPAFITALRQREGAASRGLEFLILSAARSNEVLGAKWSEIDLANPIPAGLVRTAVMAGRA